MRIDPGLSLSSLRSALTSRRRLLSKPCLILIMGVAGSGKSTLSRDILRRLCAVYLDNNHIVDAFFLNTRNSLEYERLRPRFYKVLYTIAERNLELGNSVLLDVPHIKEVRTLKWRNLITRLARKANSKMIVVRCLCSEGVLQARIRSRGEKRDQWKLSHWGKFLKEQPIATSIPFPHLDVNTEKNRSKNLRNAVRYIEDQIARRS